ncbi:hypothetical protein N805_04065 [Pseudomonas putida S13.1.2]|uniref:Histidine kinase n=1 Tax=Pseudomonas putida S13.1.2 TaxID=1384061 RepID=A0AAU8S574_PSEPU|nr:hypothetical protein N805_04065 [Pseudomonas putida S13.1.2]
MAVPDEPELDVITGSLLNAFRNAARGRRYLVGAASVQPLRLSAREISDWLEVHPLPLPRRLVDEVIFALDEAALAEEDD